MFFAPDDRGDADGHRRRTRNALVDQLDSSWNFEGLYPVLSVALVVPHVRRHPSDSAAVDFSRWYVSGIVLGNANYVHKRKPHRVS